jgi:putative hydrolase of the HAD superfamily
MVYNKPVIKVVLLDADGVVNISPVLFSRAYAERRGLDPLSIEPFFRDHFEHALTGKRDIKDLIAENNHLWQWEDDPQMLLNMWLAEEDHPNEELLPVVEALRKQGVPVYLATNQEKYRAAYFREKMFKDVFDDIFSSSDIGYAKPAQEFFESCYQLIKAKNPRIKKYEIAFFDDSPRHVAGAKKFGLKAYLFEGPEQVRSAAK